MPTREGFYTTVSIKWNKLPSVAIQTRLQQPTREQEEQRKS